MIILQTIFILLGILGLIVGATVYVFYIFFIKNAPDAEELEKAERIAIKNRSLAI